jgi:hypothetical protein
VAIPPQHSHLGVVCPFSNAVFDEFADEVTAAIQFCIGNTQKIPFTLDKHFNAALKAEGGRMLEETVADILLSVYKCAFSGKDMLGNKLVHEELIPFMDDIGMMDHAFLYVEKGWGGVCLLMILRRNHRLYRNAHNAIMGVVVHKEAEGSAKLLGGAMDALRVIKPRAVRGLLYRFHPRRNCYAEEKGGGEGVARMKGILGESGYGFTPLRCAD